LKPHFVADNIEAMRKASASVGRMIAIIGFVNQVGKDIFNSAAIVYKGEIKSIYNKICLPNYGVLDEKRYFTPGNLPSIFKTGNLAFGVNICEDIWQPDGPTKVQADHGASLIVNINASPYYSGKMSQRENIITQTSRSNNVFIAYANLVGGQDELVFDGHSMIADPTGKVLCTAHIFREDLLIADLDVPLYKSKRIKKSIEVVKKLDLKNKRPALPKRGCEQLEPTAEVYEALLLGLRDYVNKNGFTKVVLGISGGIDSCLVATLAADAIGKENVTGVFMPTRYSSKESERDARELASNLGIKYIEISIDQIYKLYLMAFEKLFEGLSRDITEENIQARIRGNILMALSNKFGWLVLTTGNKSEMSTGYATLYGDMAGGLAVIKDVPKTLVYKLARYRNAIAKVIPDAVFTKEPTAELRPEQKDRDTLPPYEVLDPIIKAYVEEDKSLGEISVNGADRETIAKVIRMIDKSEYKRRQSPPGIKITPKAFGKDRRMPITNKYR
ncbi:MAG: NAD+ synthase, partial [Candidatus Omnitrophica bacterium]|nr:NAD+ synthase [Candidatus Omnitrophota bacterium]